MSDVSGCLDRQSEFDGERKSDALYEIPIPHYSIRQCNLSVYRGNSGLQRIALNSCLSMPSSLSLSKSLT